MILLALSRRTCGVLLQKPISNGLRLRASNLAMSSVSQSRNMGHRFRPLDGNIHADGADGADGAMELKGIVFDVDGTLCEPQNYMFGEMRSALGITKDIDILDHIYGLPEGEQQDAAHEKIQAIERRAMQSQVPQPGLVPLMEFLDRWKVRKGICTRNFDMPVTHLLTQHLPPHIQPFSPIITRDFRPPKPSPAGILHIAREWNVTPPDQTSSSRTLLPLVMVGDSVDDMAAGHAAGALTVLLRSEEKEELERDGRTDVVISRLDELIGLLAGGLASAR